MEIKFIKIYLSGANRIHELYEEGQRKDDKIEELERAIRFKQLQHKGYGRELEAQLKEIETLKAKAKAMAEDRDEWARKYIESEKARKSIGEKLDKALGAIELLRGGTSAGAEAPSAQCEHWAPPPKGEARTGGARA